MVPAAVQNVAQLLTMARQAGFSARILSRALKVSPRQFRRHTHEFFGCSPQNWLDQQRLRLAPELLKKHRCIKTVAFELGFKRVSHFSREFKSHYGLCPTAFIHWNDCQTFPVPRFGSEPPAPQTDLTVLLAESLSRPATDRVPPTPLVEPQRCGGSEDAD